MTQTTTKSDPQYKCADCDKLFVKKGNLINHMKNVHSKDDIPTTEGFLDNTSYSEELDMENTFLLDAAREGVANDFFGDISDHESDEDNTVDNTVLNNDNTDTPGPSSMPKTTAPVPLCSKADNYIKKTSGKPYQPPSWRPYYQPPHSLKILTKAWRSSLTTFKSK